MPEPIDLSDVLVLVAGLNSIAGGTSASLSAMAIAGAQIHYGECHPDVSLTRNLQCYFAEQYLQQDDRIKWVFWLDHDIMIPVDAVVELRELARAVQGSVSGLYVNRHHGEPRAAAEAVRGWQPKTIELAGMKPTMLLPAFCGFGAFMQSRETFEAHLAESERFAFYTYRGVPAAFRCGLVNSDCAKHLIRTMGKCIWMSEDFDYCLQEFNANRPVYLSHVQCKHHAGAWLIPPSEVIVPGYHAELGHAP